MAVGEKLRQARVTRGLDIAALAAQLKIQSRYLVAIEAGQRDQVPSAFLYKNWVRQYAEVLGLDYGELRSDVDGVVAGEAPLPLPGQDQWTIHRKTSSSGRNAAFRLIPSLALLAVVIAGGSATYAWWRGDLPAIEWSKLRFWSGSVQAKAKVSPPARLETSLAPVVAAPPVPSPAVLLEIYAREDTWISISPDGKQLFSGVLQANQTRSVQAAHSTVVKIGNAGGLDVRLNGNPIGEIGPRGKVRILVVSPEGVKVFDPKGLTKPAPPASV